MSQIYNDNTKKSKTKENQLGILGISARELMQFAGNSAKGLRSKRERETERALLGLHIYLWKHPLKVFATLLSGSGKGTIEA